jgi:hypothetical protein
MLLSVCKITEEFLTNPAAEDGWICGQRERKKQRRKKPS